MRVQEVTLRRWHRYVGVTLMPLIVVQVISGIALSSIDLLGFVDRRPEGIAILVIRNLPESLRSSDLAMMTLHFTGGQSVGPIIRDLVGLAVVWLAFSGTWIFLRIRARTRRRR